MVRVQSFSTSCVPEGNRAALYQKFMASLFSIGLAVKRTDDHPLNTELRAYRSRHLHFASLRFSPHSTTLASCHKGGPARLLVTMQKEGVATVAQGGRASRIEAGDIFIIDLTRPFEIETGEILTHSIYLDPTRLRELVPQAAGLTALPIKSTTASPTCCPMRWPPRWHRYGKPKKRFRHGSNCCTNSACAGTPASTCASRG
jgi:hypothetical protein